MTRYGQRGGDGPTRGKKAVTFTATTPGGLVLTKRFFNDVQADLVEGVAALLPPTNGYGWSLWTVAATEKAMPGYVKSSPEVVYVPCRRIEKSRSAA
jgi:hypothetical protein